VATVTAESGGAKLVYQLNVAKIFWLKAFYRTYHPEAAVKW